MKTNTDGNLVALNAWQREQDILAEQDERDYQEVMDKVDAMFDAYFEGDEGAVEELHDHLYGNPESEERLLDILRKNFDPRPSADGKKLQDEYREFILQMCADYYGGEL